MDFKNLQNRVLLFFNFASVHSQTFTSSSYKVLDPVMNAGGYGSSTTFRLFGVISQMAIGTSSSSAFKTNASFLYFLLLPAQRSQHLQEIPKSLYPGLLLLAYSAGQ